jgi:hypothetical protein
MVDHQGDEATGRNATEQQRVARKRETSNAWRLRNPDRMRELRQAWRAVNLERSRELNRESMRRAAARRRRLEQRRATGRAWYAEHRGQERERARTFRLAHPDRVREYQLRYRERHPERATATSRAASQRWRDAHAEEVRAADRLAAEARRAADPDAFKRWYAANADVQRTRSREAGKRRRRLAALGLPPARVHRVYAAERRANDVAADAFYAQTRTAPQRRALAAENDQPSWISFATTAARRRVKAAPDVEQVREAMKHARIERERAVWARVIPGLVTAFVQRNRDRIRVDLELDAVVRRITQKPPYDIPREYTRRVKIESFEHVAARLAPEHDPARLGRLHAFMFPTGWGSETQPRSDVEARRERHAIAMADNAWRDFPPALRR